MITEHELPCNSLKPTRLPGSLSFNRQPWAGRTCPEHCHAFHLHPPSGRGRANSLHSGYYEAMLSICAGNSVHNTGVRFFFCCWVALAQYHQCRGWRAQELGRTHPWDRWAQLTKGISHTVWCIAQHIKLWKREGEDAQSDVVVVPNHTYADWSPAFLEMAEHLSAEGMYWINSKFCFTYYIVFISIHEFFHFYASDSLPRLTDREGEWASDYAELSCQLGLNHNHLVQ